MYKKIIDAMRMPVKNIIMAETRKPTIMNQLLCKNFSIGDKDA